MQNQINLVKKTDSKLTYAALAAANIRLELKAAFPGVKFSVKSENYSMGSSVNIYWTGGPAVEDVKKISNKYEYGSFDSMNDIYEYTGDRKFTETFGGAKYIFENRKKEEVSNGAAA